MARGGKGDGYRLFSPPLADLTSPAVQEKLDTLPRTIHEGRRNTAMGRCKARPFRWEARGSAAYLRSLSISQTGRKRKGVAHEQSVAKSTEP